MKRFTVARSMRSNVFSRASKHCDGRVFQHTLADTLVWMWRGYVPEKD